MIAEVIAIVPPGQKWNAFEKLFYPFQTTVWTLILVFALIGFFDDFHHFKTLKICSKFCVWKKCEKSNFESFRGLHRRIANNFAWKKFREIFIDVFLKYSLVIRTLYQGSYFKLLQSENKHKSV
jgi:hypothetical protein